MLTQPQLQSGSSDGTDTLMRSFQNPLSGFNIVAAARRQMWVVLSAIILALSIGVLYLLEATPTYTSSVSILIDAKNVGMTATTPLEGSLTFEAGALDSQLQILLSDKLASSVATSLGLQNNLTFIDPEPSYPAKVIRKVTRAVGSFLNEPPMTATKDLPENIRLLVASNILQSNMKVQRVGRTYVFELDYSDKDPVLAQAIVGQYANAYLEDQLDSKFDSTRRAANWMEERIRDLKARSLAADESVQQYRADNNLIAASGRLVDDQSLTDATTQMTAGQSALDTASARYQRLKQIVDAQDVTGSLTESLENPNVAQLRARYLQAAKLESDISSRYGPNHQAAENARKDMAEYTRLIFAELTNLLPSYQSDVAIAQARVTSIQNSITQLRRASSTNDNASVKLRSLEQESDTLKTLYSTFLQKSQELQQQQSFPVTDARVISDASIPLLPSSPKTVLVLLVSIALGGIVGFGFGALREWRDRGFRTASQIRDELGLEFIANVPSLGKSALLPHKTAGEFVQRSLAGDDDRRLTLVSSATLQAVVNQPFSQFAEAIRALRSKISLEFPTKKGIVIGMVSIFPDEGKSTIAKNLASSLALQGTSTILIDGDLRNPSLTGNLVRNPKLGLVDVVQGRASVSDVIYFEKESGLAFLPSATRTRAANDFFGSTRAHDLIDQLRRQYDVVVIDFPPVGALTDALAANFVIDGYFFVTHWGRTPRNVLKEFVTNHPHIADKTLGVVLNKVDLARLGKYGAYQGASQYSKYVGKYFSSTPE